MVIYLTGPTAGGKTELSLILAEAIQAEIVNCDALQIYEGLDIATAKADADEQARIPHHLLSVVPPDGSFNVADYQTAAKKVITEIEARGKHVLVVGGTLHYLQSLRGDYEYAAPPSDPGVRIRLEAEAERIGREALHARLAELDPERAAKLHPNDRLRVIRALEIMELSGRKASSFQPRKRLGPYDGPLYVLLPERELLYERIHQRIMRMIEAGLEAETRAFYERNPEPGRGLAKAIGYKELVPYFEGKISFEAAIEKLKQASRNFAKRQLTGLRSLEDAVRLRITPETSLNEVYRSIIRNFH